MCTAIACRPPPLGWARNSLEQAYPPSGHRLCQPFTFLSVPHGQETRRVRGQAWPSPLCLALLPPGLGLEPVVVIHSGSPSSSGPSDVSAPCVQLFLLIQMPSGRGACFPFARYFHFPVSPALFLPVTYSSYSSMSTAFSGRPSSLRNSQSKLQRGTSPVYPCSTVMWPLWPLSSHLRNGKNDAFLLGRCEVVGRTENRAQHIVSARGMMKSLPLSFCRERASDKAALTVSHKGAPQLQAGVAAHPEPTWRGSSSGTTQAQGTGVRGREGSQGCCLSYGVNLLLLSLAEIYCSAFQTAVCEPLVGL